MSFSTNDIFNAGGPGSSAEPSMEEILASIRRILKEDDTVKAAPVDLDDDVLVLDQSMIARPADMASVTYMPVEPPPPEPPAVPLQSSPEPLHFSSEPTPFAEDFIPAPEAPAPADDGTIVAMRLPETPAPAYEPAAPVQAAPVQAAPLQAAPLQAAPSQAAPSQAAPSQAAPSQAARVPAAYQPVAPEPPAYRPLIADPPAPVQAAPLQAAPLQAAPLQAAPVSYSPLPQPIRPEPSQLEEKMPNAPENVEPPHGIISDKTTDAAASSIGALVRSMSMEKSVAVSRHGVTIEDIVREEIRPLLKAWLDTHLPSLVERVVRSEIERVIDRSGT
jgi:cell pole-organizing protein PopZ